MSSFDGLDKIQIISYIAGFVDGEGCFCARVSSRDNDAVWIATCVSISNTNSAVLLNIQKFLLSVGIDSKFNTRAPKDGRRIVYSTCIYAYAEIIKFCDLVIPHLIVRRNQAIIMRAISRLRLAGYKREGKNEYEDEQLALVCSLKALNQGAAIDDIYAE